ncbi:MAG: hypothetical protein LBC68_09725 [Prevotellaceae bacterium]|jgi:DNA-binding helix-hairpin-helix protein with protein kinase domain|nr:hypothetical protein [Prevotellaceae bacterium]
MIVYSSKGEKITLADTPFSSGGEGEVRHIISPSHLKGNCVKIYYVQKRSKQLADKIRFMVDNPPQQIEQRGFKISWAVDTILQNNQFIGFMMPLAFPDSKKLVVLTAPQLSKKLDGTWYKYDRKHGKASLVNRLKLMSNIAIPIHLLHATGKYVLQDFKPDNVLITHSGQVTICDMDSIQITNGQKMLFRGTAATAGYAPPEYENGGVGKSATVPLTKSWDNFALSVVFYQLLFGLHPYAVTPKIQKDATESNISTNVSDDLFPFGNNAHKIQIVPPLHDKFKILPTNIQSLFKRSFSLKANLRPDAEEWGKIIHEIINSAGIIPETPPPPPVFPKPQDDFIKCANGHYYNKMLNKCPFCTKQEPSKPHVKNKGCARFAFVFIFIIIVITAAIIMASSSCKNNSYYDCYQDNNKTTAVYSNDKEAIVANDDVIEEEYVIKKEPCESANKDDYSAMESGDHFKNGASPKSLTSRESKNYKK